MTLTEFTELPISRRKKYTDAAKWVFENNPGLIDPVGNMVKILFGNK